MFAVIFEVQPKKSHWDDYLNLAKRLKPELAKIDGFLDNERFGSTRTQGRILSLSTWRDEKALIRWRTLGVHHEVQERGRFEIFADYHLRVAEITADSEAPKDQELQQQRFDLTEVGTAKFVTISEVTPCETGTSVASDLEGLPENGAHGVVDREVFESIYNPGKLLLLVSWSDAAACERFAPTSTAAGTLRHRRARVIRDYGLSDRREAPQYYPAVATSQGLKPKSVATAPRVPARAR
jgi:heme-degrading monooxygenase HmoA